MNDKKPTLLHKLTLQNFRFFQTENNVFEFDGENALIYGENGSGKSSIYKAFELLIKMSENPIDIKDFQKHRNIFNLENDDYFLEFNFDGRFPFDLRIDEDHLSLDDSVNEFFTVKPLHIFNPLLDYKKLLKVHYAQEESKINLFSMFELLLSNYPIKGTDDKKLKDLKEGNVYKKEYLLAFKDITNEILEPVNYFLNKLSDQSIKLDKIDFDEFERSIHLDINFYDEKIDVYHIFFNEARLSALAIAVYFTCIKQLSQFLIYEELKVLILDDLLLSLDMSNRMKLLPILRDDFSDFQIIFLTHDKELFDLYKEKLQWKAFEIYIDDSAEINKPMLKIGNSDLEKAIEHYANKNYDCCAVLLRKESEKLIKQVLPDKEHYDKNCKVLQLGNLLEKAINQADKESKELLKQLKTYTKIILNPQAHDDKRPIYSQELKEVIEIIRELKRIIKK